jgi:putative transposase
LAYALMGNHVHLIVVPERADSMACAVGNAHRKHATIVNWRAGWTGHLWAHRFYSTPLDEAHLWAAVRYVELNPVRAGIVSDPCSFPWSSAAAHARIARSTLLDPAWPPPEIVPDWARWLREGLASTTDETIRRATRTGRPAGSAAFVGELEAVTGRCLRSRKGGRKSATTTSSL